MEPIIQETCTRCETDIHKKNIKPEHADINTQSLLLMFRIHELVEVECPRCGYKGFHI